MLLEAQLEADARLVVVAPVPAQDILAANFTNDRVVVSLARLHGLDKDRILDAKVSKDRAQRRLRNVSEGALEARSPSLAALSPDVRHLRLRREPRGLRGSKLRVAVGPPRPDELDERHDLLVRLSRA